jgi:hypothetical protein
MINFFRKKRKKMADDNKPLKYMRYAIGEILLVVIGILIALQVNNWNENRKRETQFKVTLERLYNTLNSDTETFKAHIIGLEYQVDLIDYVLNYSDSISSYDLPYLLHDLKKINTKYKSESVYHSQNLIYNLESPEQNGISKQIISYINRATSDDFQIDDLVHELIQELGIPAPKVDPDNPNKRILTIDSTYYSKKEINMAIQLVNSDKFKATLKTARTNNIFEKATINVSYSDALSIIRMIKKYYPDARLLYEDVGIIGTSLNGFDDSGGISTPMIRTVMDKNIWEIDLFLKVGRLKFRCRDSWSQNWGGDTFPNGEAVYFGGDIPVSEAGNYHIILNLSKNSYDFIKQDN